MEYRSRVQSSALNLQQYTMSEINYKALKAYLKETPGKDLLPVYLIFGEESLFKTAFNSLLDALLPESKRGFNYDPMDGTDENIQPVIERMNTFSLLSGPKVIALLESRIFYAKQDYAKLFEKAKEAFYVSLFAKTVRIYIVYLNCLVWDRFRRYVGFFL